jgi:hypothetical protein
MNWQPAESTATNPNTGERIALVSGQWMPYLESATNPQTGQRLVLVGAQAPASRIASTDEAAQAYEQSRAVARAAEERARVGVAPPQPPPSLGQQLVGAAETGLALATGATGGAVGFIGGTGVGLAQEILSGRFGTQAAQERVNQAAQGSEAQIRDAMPLRRVFTRAQQGAQALTYAPRTAAGQEMTQSAGQFLGEALPPVLPIIGAPGAVIAGAAPVARQAAIAAAPVAQAVAAAPGRAVQAVRGAVGMGETAPATRAAGASIGAAATPAATRRGVVAEQFGVRPTLGQLLRDEEQLAFEQAAIKKPEGGPLRDRARENNVALLTSAERIIDETGARFVEKADVGDALTSTLLRGADQERTKVRALYADARKSPEAQARVDPNVRVVIGQGDLEAEGSLISFLNEQPVGVPSSAVTDSARKIAVKMGVAREDEGGNLVGIPATVGQMEDFRKEIVGLADRTDARALRQETILKKLVDAQTAPVAGPLFRQARAARSNMARKFENRAVIANLISRRGGSEDMRVSADRAFDTAVLNAPRGEVRFLRQVLGTLGEEGRQAWAEIQGATVRHILNAATQRAGGDANDQPILSADKLNRAVRGLDANDRLDIILGKKRAQELRDLNEVTQYIKTLPPDTAVNTSGTTESLLRAITTMTAESGAQFVASGIPIPVLSIANQIRKARAATRNRQELEARINEALTGIAAQSTGAAP